MARHVELEFAAGTDAGLLRPRNEDAVATDAQLGLAVLADGMGGYRAGEVASALAIESVQQALAGQLLALQPDAPWPGARSIRRMLADAVAQGNAAIRAAASANPEHAGMGTTIVVALFGPDAVTVAHVGDSRCYRLRQGELALLTRDHSRVQQLVDAGLLDAEEARFSPERHLVTRALGIDDSVEAEIHQHALQENDLYLLCSDGLTDMLATQEIDDLLQQPGTDPGAACAALIAAANRNGGRDNISVILARVRTLPAAANGGFGRLWRWRGKGQ